MPAIDIATDYSHRYGPSVQVINMVIEQTVVNQIDQKSWISRPGLSAIEATEGVLRGMTDTPTTLIAANRSIVYAAGTGLWSQSVTPGDPPSFLGTIAGTDFVSFATTPQVLLACAGDTLYRYDTTGFATLTMPDGELVSWVTYLAGYFLIGVKDSEVIFFMVPSATAPAALDFFSAEVGGDNHIRAIPLGDQLAIFCESHTEFWQASGDVNLPFNRIVGQLYSKGLAGRFAVAILDNSIYFLGSDTCVYRADAQPVNVGNPTISAQFSGIVPENFFAWAFVMDNHAYLVMTINRGSAGTLVLDVSAGRWVQWTSFNSITTARPFAGVVGLQVRSNTTQPGLVFCGGISNEMIWQVSSSFTDDAGTNIDAFLVGGVAVVQQQKRCDSVTLIMDAGTQGAPVTVSLATSDDQGNTVSAFDAISIVPGNFTGNPVWWQLGLMQQPMRLFYLEFQNSGPVRVWTARYNEAVVS